MSYYDFTKQYGATQKAKFWCDYMAGLRGQLQALDSPRAPSKVSIWSRVNTNEVLLYDVLYGDYFRAAGQKSVLVIISYTIIYYVYCCVGMI